MRSSKTLPNKRTRYTKLQVATDKGTAFREKLKKEKLLHVKEWEPIKGPIFSALSKLSDREAGRYKTAAIISNLHYYTHFLSPPISLICILGTVSSTLNFNAQSSDVTQEKLLCSNTILVIQQHEYSVNKIITFFCQKTEVLSPAQRTSTRPKRVNVADVHLFYFLCKKCTCNDSC